MTEQMSETEEMISKQKEEQEKLAAEIIAKASAPKPPKPGEQNDNSSEDQSYPEPVDENGDPLDGPPPSSTPEEMFPDTPRPKDAPPLLDGKLSFVCSIHGPQPLKEMRYTTIILKCGCEWTYDCGYLSQLRRGPK